MVTLCVMPNMVGSKLDLLKGLVVCLALDAMYIVPFVI